MTDFQFVDGASTLPHAYGPTESKHDPQEALDHFMRVHKIDKLICDVLDSVCIDIPEGMFRPLLGLLVLVQTNHHCVVIMRKMLSTLLLFSGCFVYTQKGCCRVSLYLSRSFESFLSCAYTLAIFCFRSGERLRMAHTLTHILMHVSLPYASGSLAAFLTCFIIHLLLLYFKV